MSKLSKEPQGLWGPPQSGPGAAQAPGPSWPGLPQQPYVSYPPPPTRRRRWLVPIIMAVAGLAIGSAATALILGDRGRETAPPAEPNPASAAPPTSSEAKVLMCETLEREYPAIVAAINDRNKYNREPWTNRDLIRTSDKLVQVASSAATEIERSMTSALPAKTAKAAADYVTGLRALSIADSNRAVAKQLNGVASLYNSVVDPVLAECGIEG